MSNAPLWLRWVLNNRTIELDALFSRMTRQASHAYLAAQIGWSKIFMILCSSIFPDRLRVCRLSSWRAPVAKRASITSTTFFDSYTLLKGVPSHWCSNQPIRLFGAPTY